MTLGIAGSLRGGGDATDSTEADGFREPHVRSIAKAVSYRVLGTSLTVVSAWMLTSQWSVAAGLGLVDCVGKIVVFYLHERLWDRIDWGRSKPPEYTI